MQSPKPRSIVYNSVQCKSETSLFTEFEKKLGVKAKTAQTIINRDEGVQTLKRKARVSSKKVKK